MAIPEEYESKETLAAREHFLRIGLNGLEQLYDEDALLIGRLVSIYSFNELNLRRAIEAFCEKDLLQRKKYFRPSELVSSVKAGVKRIVPSGVQLERDLANLDEIELRRSFRNMFAHFAIKRLNGMNAAVFMTMDTNDSAAVHRRTRRAADSMTFSVMMIEDIRGLLGNVVEHGEWLAVRTSEWLTAVSSRQ